jgi:primosomal protein N' (replication factor Y)
VRLTALRIQGRVEADVQKTALAIAIFCRKFAKMEEYRLETLGPAPSPLDKIADNYRWQVLLKGSDSDHLHAVCVAVRAEHNTLVKSGCSLTIDVDPENMM